MRNSIIFTWLVSLENLMPLPLLISQWYKTDIVPFYLKGWGFFHVKKTGL